MRGTLLGGRYRLQSKIGEGGMAYVYVALDEKLGRKVAIKILHQHMADNQDIRQRFFQEAKAISSLDHPNVLKIFDFSGENSPELWIVTEILQGSNLNEYIRSFPGRWLHPVVATLITREILKALEKAHSDGLIHRDIKPENIMVLNSGGIKLMDFGIAKNMKGSSITVTGTFMGSPSYMSPEQIRGKSIDQRSDLYSLGVLFYEILTGKLPYTGNSTHDVVLKICEGNCKEPKVYMPNLPDDLNRMVLKAMDKYPSNRYQEARSFARDLDTFLMTSGFEESHIELERFFSDRERFEDRLRKLENQQGPTVILAPNASSDQITEINHKDTRTRYEVPQKTINQSKSDLTVKKESNPSPNNNQTMLNFQHNQVSRVSENDALRYTQQQASFTTQRAGTRAQTQRSPNNPSIPSHPNIQRKKRNQPARPKRVIARRVIYKQAHRTNTQYSNATSELVSFVSGIILVGIILTLSIYGFYNLQKKNPSGMPITSLPSSVVIPKHNDTNQSNRDNLSSTQKQNDGGINNLKNTRSNNRISESKKLNSKANDPTNKTTYPNRTNPKNDIHDNRKEIPRLKANSTKNPAQSASEENQPPPRISSTGFLRISSQPAAEIFIDGQHKGTTVDKTLYSSWIKLESGSHEIVLKRNGYENFIQTVVIARNERKQINDIRLSSDHSYQVSISASKQPVRVSIFGLSDRSKKTIILRGTPQIANLSAGRYQLRFIYNGQQIERNLILNGNDIRRSLNVDFK